MRTILLITGLLLLAGCTPLGQQAGQEGTAGGNLTQRTEQTQDVGPKSTGSAETVNQTVNQIPGRLVGAGLAVLVGIGLIGWIAPVPPLPIYVRYGMGIGGLGLVLSPALLIFW